LKFNGIELDWSENLSPLFTLTLAVIVDVCDVWVW
jgi:hypothetical protein